MRHKIVEIIAFLAYWTGIDALFYWLNRKAKRIVTFHNVLPDAMYRYDLANGVSNSESGFSTDCRGDCEAVSVFDGCVGCEDVHDYVR